MVQTNQRLRPERFRRDNGLQALLFPSFAEGTNSTSHGGGEGREGRRGGRSGGHHSARTTKWEGGMGVQKSVHTVTFLMFIRHPLVKTTLQQHPTFSLFQHGLSHRSHP